jgi:hypothetical protein
LLFHVWLIGFTVANVINRCSPGWCETIGLPFPWRSWSDVIVDVGDFSMWMAGITWVVAGVFNLVAFAAVAGALTRVGMSKGPA